MSSHPIFNRPKKRAPQIKLEGTTYKHIVAQNESEAQRIAEERASGPYREKVSAGRPHMVGTAAGNVPIYDVGVSWQLVPPGAVRRS